MIDIIPTINCLHDAKVTREAVVVGQRQIWIERPADMDRLIDNHQVSEMYDASSYMPYWANIWPVSRVLAAKIMSTPWSSAASVLELGCGLGLAGLAAMMAGHDVTFSDYDENALTYAVRNARINGFIAPKILPMNWRNPVDQTFQLIIGADLTWDQELVPAVVKVFHRMLAPGGIVWLTDQNRLDHKSFAKMLDDVGLKITNQSPIELDESWGWDIKGTFYEIRHCGVR